MNTNDKSTILGILSNVVTMLGKLVATDEKPVLIEEPKAAPDIAVNGIDRLAAILSGVDVPPLSSDITPPDSDEEDDCTDERDMDKLFNREARATSRANEVNALGNLWVSECDMNEMKAANAHFDKEPSHRHHERVSSEVESIQIVSMAPANDISEATELVFSWWVQVGL